jgi:hypothetical protein
MSDSVAGDGVVRAATPVHLWIVGVVSLLWNSYGAFDYLATKLKLDSHMSGYPPEVVEYFDGFPAWATAFWAFGVWGAVAGSIGLLLRKSWAMWAFAVSILGLVGTTLYSYGFSNGAEIMGPFGVVFTVVLFIVAILLLLYSRAMAQHGVLT